MIKRLPQRTFPILGNHHRKIALGLASLPIVVPVGYILDVSSIGRMAGWIYDIGVQLQGVSIFSTPEQKAAAAQCIKMGSYISNHTGAVTQAWLTGSYEPGMPVKELETIKEWWQWGNLSSYGHNTLVSSNFQWGHRHHKATRVHA